MFLRFQTYGQGISAIEVSAIDALVQQTGYVAIHLRGGTQIPVPGTTAAVLQFIEENRAEEQPSHPASEVIYDAPGQPGETNTLGSWQAPDSK